MVWNNSINSVAATSRRSVAHHSLHVRDFSNLRFSSATGEQDTHPEYSAQRINPMTSITTKDGTQIFYKDWGPKSAQPIVFHHGWPLSADDWDNQMLFFLGKGYRVIAHDRRGHGRSSQIERRQRHGSPTPPTSPRWPSTSTCGMPSTSAIRPAAAKPRAMSRATARAASPRWC